MRAERWFSIVLIARGARSIAYGALGVVVAIALARRGYSSSQIGALLSLTLATGAAFSLFAASIARRVGERATLIAGCAVMAIAGALFAAFSSHALTAAAFALGTLTAGGQDVGPFSSLEQSIIGMRDPKIVSDRFALYNTVSIACAAVGAALVSAAPLGLVLWIYPAAAFVMSVAYALLPPLTAPQAPDPSPPRRFGAIEQLAALFAVDALAGGFIVQAVIAYWLHMRFGTPLSQIGSLLAAANVLSAMSFFAAARLARRFGLLNTMVFTHLPSNVLLLLVPVMPSFAWAAALLLARFALSQMDVPTRQAYVMQASAPHERARAASMTTAVRPAAAAVSPLVAGIAMQTAALGAPFVLAGTLKIAYDLTLFFRFRNQRRSEPL